MVRRATQEYCFSVSQLLRLVELLPAKAHVELLVTVFARLTDPEFLRVDELLGWEQIQELQQRLGASNMFNPYRPERKYLLVCQTSHSALDLCLPSKDAEGLLKDLRTWCLRLLVSVLGPRT